MRSESKRVLPKNIAYLERPGRATKPELGRFGLTNDNGFPALHRLFRHIQTLFSRPQGILVNMDVARGLEMFAEEG